MRDSSSRTSSTGGRLPPELLLPATVLAAYGVVRILAAAWGPLHVGPPGSLLEWSVVVGNGAAAMQGFVAAVVVVGRNTRWSRALRDTGAGAAALVWLCVAVWVARGHGEAMPQVRDLLLASGLAVAISILGGWRPRWADGPDGIAWSHIDRALRSAIGGAVVLGVAGVVVYFAARPADAAHRLTVLLLELGFWGAFVLFLCLLMVVGEQRRLRRQTVMDDLYAQLNDQHQRRDDGAA
jgi:hypothetical protein